MNKILILFSHPRFEKSRANSLIIDQIKDKDGVTFHDLYELYPDFNIDIEAEKQMLLEHDVIIWHHPFYWYSCPPLMKQWIDLVLQFNWAYGPKGEALKGKICMNAITTGGTKEVYCKSGTNHYTVSEFLRPFEQTAIFCGMEYMPPFMVMGTHSMTKDQIEKHADQYNTLLDLLRNDLSCSDVQGVSFINDIAQLKTK